MKWGLLMNSASRLLSFDPTPAGLVGNRNLRLAFKSEWARIRNRHFIEDDVRCVLCGAERDDRTEIESHEVYSFPSVDVVYLERVIFICKQCHHAIHLERTRWRCGPVYVAEVEAHYAGSTETYRATPWNETSRIVCSVAKKYPTSMAQWHGHELTLATIRLGRTRRPSGSEKPMMTIATLKCIRTTNARGILGTPTKLLP